MGRSGSAIPIGVLLALLILVAFRAPAVAAESSAFDSTLSSAPSEVDVSAPLPAIDPEPRPLADDWLTAPPAPDRHNLWVPTVEALAGMGVILAGTMVDPEFSNTEPPSFENIVEAFTKPPETSDGDNAIINYVLHPEMGAELYLLVRNRDYEPWVGFLFSTAGSFLWEYVLEGAVERPSAIDLLLTSPLGSILGEIRYQARQSLIADPPSTWRDTWIVLVDGIEAFHRWLERPDPVSGSAFRDDGTAQRRDAVLGLSITFRY